MLRKRFGERQVGHGGTLDPDATGVLVVAVGKATKLLRFVEKTQKGYVGEVVLGTRDQHARLGRRGHGHARHVARHDRRRPASVVAEHLIGRHRADPTDGVGDQRSTASDCTNSPAQGIEVDRPPRPVTIHSFDVDPTDEPGVLRDRCRVLRRHLHPHARRRSGPPARWWSTPSQLAPNPRRRVHPRRGGPARRVRAAPGARPPSVSWRGRRDDDRRGARRERPCPATPGTATARGRSSTPPGS